jgi:hypothetical protein
VETSKGNAGSKYTQSAARIMSGRRSSGSGFALEDKVSVRLHAGATHV